MTYTKYSTEVVGLESVLGLLKVIYEMISVEDKDEVLTAYEVVDNLRNKLLKKGQE